jgi:hypothetical protein
VSDPQCPCGLDLAKLCERFPPVGGKTVVLACQCGGRQKFTFWDLSQILHELAHWQTRHAACCGWVLAQSNDPKGGA